MPLAIDPMSILIAALSLWLQITPPYGSYPFSASHPDIKFILDTNSVSFVTFKFHKARAYEVDWEGIPVDIDHASLKTKSFEKMATITDLKVKPDGSIHCLFVFTPVGEELWKRGLTGRSPVFGVSKCGEGKFCPIRLESVALTDHPLFKDLRE